MDEMKYKLTGNTRVFRDKTLYQIVSLKKFHVAGVDIEPGRLGGYVESEANLSQYGNCWIFSNSIAMDKAFVKDDAILRYGSLACDNVLIFGHAVISESGIYNYGKVGNFASVSNAAVYDNAVVLDHASITGEGIFHPMEREAPQPGDTYVAGYARISGYAKIWDGPAVYDYATVSGHSRLSGPIKVHEEAKIEGNSQLFDHCEIKGDVLINFFEEVGGDAVLM